MANRTENTAAKSGGANHLDELDAMGPSDRKIAVLEDRIVAMEQIATRMMWAIEEKNQANQLVACREWKDLVREELP